MPSRISRRQVVGVAGLAAATAGCLNELTASDEEFPEDDIDVIVPYAAGGVFDSYARNLIPAWEDLINEESDVDINMVVDNVTGGGGATGLTEVHNADPDGHTLALVPIPGLAVGQELRDVGYDLQEMTHLGMIGEAPFAVAVNPDLGLDGVEDLTELDSIDWSILSPDNTAGSVAILLSDAMGLNSQFIAGYGGAPELLTAVQQGEVDATVMSVGIVRAFAPDVQPVLQFGDEYDPAWTSDEQDNVALKSDISALDDLPVRFGHSWRIVVGPPELNEDALELLESTLLDAAASSEFEEWGEEAGQPTAAEPGSVVNEIINEQSEFYAENIEIIKAET